MKKLSVIIAVVAALAVIGCASSGGSGDGAPAFVVDLSTVNQHVIVKDGARDTIGESLGSVMRNQEAYTRNWQGAIYVFPDNFIDHSRYTRVTIRLKYFNVNGEELSPRDSMGMAVLINDLDGTWQGPEMGPGPNTPLKEFNVMGFSGLVSQDRGVRVRLTQTPKGLFIQKAQDANVAFIELTEIVFHNGNYESTGFVAGAGPEGSDE